VCPHLLLKPFTTIGSLSRVVLMFRNFAVLIVYVVLIKANPFALVLTRAYRSILCLLCDIVQGIVKCFPLIS
jgi:hypothetical protein